MLHTIVLEEDSWLCGALLHLSAEHIIRVMINVTADIVHTDSLRYLCCRELEVNGKHRWTATNEHVATHTPTGAICFLPSFQNPLPQCLHRLRWKPKKFSLQPMRPLKETIYTVTADSLSFGKVPQCRDLWRRLFEPTRSAALSTWNHLSQMHFQHGITWVSCIFNTESPGSVAFSIRNHLCQLHFQHGIKHRSMI